jgi:tetratricopeptide (TPR) repeat protein
MNAGWTAWMLIVSLAGDPPPADPPAPAAEKLTSGEDLFRRGVAAYDEHDYPTAIDWFRKAYAKDSEPAILFNIAQAHRALGDCPKALESIDAFLRLARPNDPLVARARAKRDELNACVATSEEHGQTSVVPLAATPSPVLPQPAASLTLRAEPGAIERDRPRFLATPLATTCTVAAGGTVALGLTDLVLVIAAHTFASRVEGATVWTDEIESAEDKRRTLASAATVTAVAVGVTAAIAGTSCWLHWRRTHERGTWGAP